MRVRFERLKFLVAEDSAAMRQVLCTLLTGFGARAVVEASDGAEAYDCYVSEAPDIVITDWEMPGVDGVALARRIRDAARSPNPFTPIILVTAFAERQRVMDALDAGVNEYLVKPITARGLCERIVNVLADPRPFLRAPGYFGPDRRSARTRQGLDVPAERAAASG